MGEYMKMPRDVHYVLIDSLFASIRELDKMAGYYHAYGGKSYLELAER